MKKNILLIIMSGLIFASGVLAGTTLINSNQVSYKDTTVDLALDDLFNNSLSGKNKIAEAITNKGIETLSTDSYDTMVANINSISQGNPYLKYDGETGYIQAMKFDNSWVNIYPTTELPLNWDGYILKNGSGIIRSDMIANSLKEISTYTESGVAAGKISGSFGSYIDVSSSLVKGYHDAQMGGWNSACIYLYNIDKYVTAYSKLNIEYVYANPYNLPYSQTIAIRDSSNQNLLSLAANTTKTTASLNISSSNVTSTVKIYMKLPAWIDSAQSGASQRFTSLKIYNIWLS